ncbi:hypothetical protein MMC22_009066 [Lobaria immixta]|nr:hypothetical protein [Lobaria immixta]
MDATAGSQANTSGVSSRRNKRKATRAAKKNGNGNDLTNASSSTQQPAADGEGSSDGKTRMVNGIMEYRSDDGWIPAIYHDDIRDHLLAEGPQGVYEFPRKQGKGLNDITSFHPDYKSNGPDRANRHKILFRYKQDGYPVPSYTPETWMSREQLVLDPDNDPVIKWHEIPLVLSSAYEGYDMEVVRRLNLNISFRDFRARMPRSFIKGTTRKSSLGLSTLSMRNTRFRLNACCLVWADRQGSDVLKAYLDEILPANCHADNSTESFRDLTNFEVRKARFPNKGKFLKRAGKRALDEGTRQQRDKVEKQRSGKRKAQYSEIVGAAPLTTIANPALQIQRQKRKRPQSSLNSEGEDESTRPAKRQQWAGNIDPTLLRAEDPRDNTEAFVTSGLGFNQSNPKQQSEIPELPTQAQNPDDQKLELEQDSEISGFAQAGSNGEAEQAPMDPELPGAQISPYHFDEAQGQAFASKQSLDQDTDFRFVYPTNETKGFSIQMALRCTRLDCRYRLRLRDLEIPSTHWETYSNQYMEIQGLFEQLWTHSGKGEEPPVLVFLEPWGGDFDSWKALSIEDEL